MNKADCLLAVTSALLALPLIGGCGEGVSAPIAEVVDSLWIDTKPSVKTSEWIVDISDQDSDVYIYFDETRRSLNIANEDHNIVLSSGEIDDFYHAEISNVGDEISFFYAMAEDRKDYITYGVVEADSLHRPTLTRRFSMPWSGIVHRRHLSNGSIYLNLKDLEVIGEDKSNMVSVLSVYDGAVEYPGHIGRMPIALENATYYISSDATQKISNVYGHKNNTFQVTDLNVDSFSLINGYSQNQIDYVFFGYRGGDPSFKIILSQIDERNAVVNSAPFSTSEILRTSVGVCGSTSFIIGLESVNSQLGNLVLIYNSENVWHKVNIGPAHDAVIDHSNDYPIIKSYTNGKEGLEVTEHNVMC